MLVFSFEANAEGNPNFNFYLCTDKKHVIFLRFFVFTTLLEGGVFLSLKDIKSPRSETFLKYQYFNIASMLNMTCTKSHVRLSPIIPHR